MRSTKEDILLRRLLFDPEEEETPGLVRLIQEDLDWDYFVEKSGIEYVSPVIYYRLKCLGLDKIIPAAAFLKLEKFYRINLERNLVILGEAKRVLERFRMEGVDFIVLKGLALAESVYPHFALRQMSDVDILIRKDRVAVVDKLLKDLSYAAVDSRPEEALRSPIGYLASLEYRKDSSEFLAFHLHWHLVNTTTPAEVFADKIDLRRVWEKALPSRVADVTGKILNPEHQIIFLCEHALRAGHSFDRLILVYDIYRVIKHSGAAIDWDGLISETRSFGLIHLVYSGLCVVKCYIPEAVPDPVLARIRPQTVSVWERIFLFLLYRDIRIRGLGILVYVGMHRGILQKISFLFRIFIPPAATISHKAYAGKRNGIGPYAGRLREVTSHFLSMLMKLMSRR